MKNKLTIMILLFGLFSCAQKLYVKEDYTLYDKNFVLPATSLLQTNGVYVLESIWTDENGERKPNEKEHMFYKFYKTGQVNLIVDLDNTIKTEQDYIERINQDFQQYKEGKKQTLFEGYYKLKEDKIVIQRKVVPRKQFNYRYGYVQDDKLIIVTSTHLGKGEFDEKHFTNFYKETYQFKPLSTAKLENQNPYW